MTRNSQQGSDSITPVTEKLTRRTLLATAAAGLGTALVRGDATAAEAAGTGTSADERRLVSNLGERSPYYYNNMRAWAVSANGVVTFGLS